MPLIFPLRPGVGKNLEHTSLDLGGGVVGREGKYIWGKGVRVRGKILLYWEILLRDTILSTLGGYLFNRYMSYKAKVFSFNFFYLTAMFALKLSITLFLRVLECF